MRKENSEHVKSGWWYTQVNSSPRSTHNSRSSLREKPRTRRVNPSHPTLRMHTITGFLAGECFLLTTEVNPRPINSGNCTKHPSNHPSTRQGIQETAQNFHPSIHPPDKDNFISPTPWNFALPVLRERPWPSTKNFAAAFLRDSRDTPTHPAQLILMQHTSHNAGIFRTVCNLDISRLGSHSNDIDVYSNRNATSTLRTHRFRSNKQHTRRHISNRDLSRGQEHV